MFSLGNSTNFNLKTLGRSLFLPSFAKICIRGPFASGQRGLGLLRRDRLRTIMDPVKITLLGDIISLSRCLSRDVWFFLSLLLILPNQKVVFYLLHCMLILYPRFKSASSWWAHFHPDHYESSEDYTSCLSPFLIRKAWRQHEHSKSYFSSCFLLRLPSATSHWTRHSRWKTFDDQHTSSDNSYRERQLAQNIGTSLFCVEPQSVLLASIPTPGHGTEICVYSGSSDSSLSSLPKGQFVSHSNPSSTSFSDSSLPEGQSVSHSNPSPTSFFSDSTLSSLLTGSFVSHSNPSSISFFSSSLLSSLPTCSFVYLPPWFFFQRFWFPSSKHVLLLQCLNKTRLQ